YPYATLFRSREGEPLLRVGGVGDDLRVERLVRGHEPAEQAGEHLGVAGVELARGLAPGEQVGLQAHDLVVVGDDALVDEGVGGEHRGARRSQEEAAEVRALTEPTDLEVDEPVELLDRRAVGLEHLADAGHELLAPAQEDLPEQVVLALEERVDGPDRELRQLGDLLEGRRVEALAAEDLLGRVEQLRAADLLVVQAALLTTAEPTAVLLGGHP